MAKIRVTKVEIVRYDVDVHDDGSIDIVAFDSAGREIGRQEAIEYLNDYYNKETNQ